LTALTDFYDIGNFIDTFALGHYARVYEAIDRRTNQMIALKIMRAEHLTEDGQPRWEAEAFINEMDLLLSLDDLPEVMRVYDCGYLESTEKYPRQGGILSCGTNLNAFREAFYPSLKEGWRPYLALEALPRQNNLLYVMKPATDGQRRRLPTEEGIALALQFGGLLYRAHERNIVYMDHKLEHVYWDGQRLKVIDWNSSKRVDGAAAGQQKINDLHNLCVGILYPIFTGAAPQKGSLRPQPGSRAEVESRYEGITQLDFTIEPSLSHALMTLLERGAGKQIHSATLFLADMQRIAVRFGWNFPGQNPAPAALQARDHVRMSLEKLRTSQEVARLAREYLLEAAALDGINEDIENELRRLISEIGDYLNARVIP
jgi:serine/threonine protein kinase